MKQFILAHAAALVLLITTVIANTACVYIIHQEPLPERAKKLRKF